MPSFAYKAVSANGKTVKGNMTVGDEHALEALLSEKGLYLIEAKEKNVAKKAGSSKKSGGKVKRTDLVEFCTGMLPMLSSGIPLVDCLDAMVDEIQNPALGDTLKQVKENIESGNNMSDAMSRHPKAFPAVMINLIKAGEYSGNLDMAFSELRDYFIWLNQLHGDIKQATIYPSMVIIAAIGFIMLLFTFVVPRFAKLLSSFDMELPMPTRVVMGTGEFMSEYWPFMFTLPIFIWLFVKFGKKYSEKFAIQFEMIRFKLPVFGELNRIIAMSRMCKNLSIMYRSGIPILEALEFCKDLVGSLIVSNAMMEIKQDISDGSTIANAYRQHDIFPPMVVRMIAVGESTGNLDQTLGHISTHYDDEIPRRIKKVFGILEPVIIMTLIGIVGFVALAIFLPMISMMGSI